MSKYAIAFLAAVSLVSAQVPPPAPAPGPAPRDPAKMFHKLDKDGDNRLSLQEFEAHGKKPAKREKLFHKLDTNQDNFLSFEEFSAPRSHA